MTDFDKLILMEWSLQDHMVFGQLVGDDKWWESAMKRVLQNGSWFWDGAGI